MDILEGADKILKNASYPLLVGLLTIIGFYCGRGIRKLKLPSILAYMILGIVLGPSLLNFLDEQLQENLSFIVEITLAFIAFHIGLELNMKSIKKLGKGIAWVIFLETYGALFLVMTGIYLLTNNLPLALILGSIAPASAPAGTVAVIRENEARGPLTKSLYAVVGFDDGLTIINFGFFASLAKNLLLRDMGQQNDISFFQLIYSSFFEIFLVCIVGVSLAYIFSSLVKKIRKPRNMLILVFGFVMITLGISSILHISMILTNMMFGFVIVNTQDKKVVERIELRIYTTMPLLFILFFSLAGASLHVDKFFTMGLIGIIYIVFRISGLMGGAWLGAVIGKMPRHIRKYIGMGILSQAGVAIGLSLIVKQDFKGLGLMGEYIGALVLTTIVATSVFFEILGPILTRIALEKNAEIALKDVE